MAIRSKYADPQFWVDTADRAIATFFQAGIAALGISSTGIIQANLIEAASVGGLAALIAVGTSIAFRGNGTDASTKPVDPTFRPHV